VSQGPTPRGERGSAFFPSAVKARAWERACRCFFNPSASPQGRPDCRFQLACPWRQYLVLVRPSADSAFQPCSNEPAPGLLERHGSLRRAGAGLAPIQLGACWNARRTGVGHHGPWEEGLDTGPVFTWEEAADDRACSDTPANLATFASGKLTAELLVLRPMALDREGRSCPEANGLRG